MAIAREPAPACSVEARVTSVQRVCREHVRIEAALSEFPPSTPGQFLQLLCREAHAAATDLEREWPADAFPSIQDADFRAPQPYLRRPFSIADRYCAADGTTRLGVISRTVGVGTAWLERLRVGDVLNLTGPLGRGFRVPPAPRPLLLIGGGVGIPPLLYLARELHARAHPEAYLVLGAVHADLLPVELADAPDPLGRPRPCVALPGGAAYPAVITTDDGSLGLRGRVTDALPALADQLAGPTPLVLACGPDGMLRAVAEQTRTRGWNCQLCIERNMGCGTGTCLSCVVRRRSGAAADWHWALACRDGPVFDRDELPDYDTP